MSLILTETSLYYCYCLLFTFDEYYISAIKLKIYTLTMCVYMYQLYSGQYIMTFLSFVNKDTQLFKSPQ
jgi:hypothetical protein